MSTTDATTQPPAAEPKEKEKPRPYLVASAVTLDLSQDPATIVAALEALAPDSSAVEILVTVGKPEALQPKAAIKVLGQSMDLSGEFEVIAQNSITTVPNVSIGTERVVRVG